MPEAQESRINVSFCCFTSACQKQLTSECGQTGTCADSAGVRQLFSALWAEEQRIRICTKPGAGTGNGRDGMGLACPGC